MTRKRKKTTENGENNPAAVVEKAMARYRGLLDSQTFSALQAELGRPLRQALRFNPLKVNPSQHAAVLAARYGWELTPVPFCSNGWWVESAQTPPSMTIEHRLGQYYIQDAASMVPAELFTFEADTPPLILDMAASPGGKTTHLIDKTADRGLVIANDAGRERLTALKLVLQGWGTLSSAVTCFPGERFGPWFPETFDYVLLDAPCSMESLRSTESHPMRAISERERKNLARRQTRLLESALQAVKVGGQVVYSTCTLAPEEDEAVLDNLLKKYPGAFQIDDPALRLSVPAPALTADEYRQYPPQIEHAVRLWPHVYRTSGFFAARITKLEAVPTQRQPHPARPLSQTHFEPLPTAEADLLIEQFHETFAFDLEAVLEQYHLELWKNGARMHAFPAAYLEHFADFPCQALGLSPGDNTAEGFLPSYDWITRFAERMPSGRCRLSEEQSAEWIRGEDIRQSPAQLDKGQPLIIEGPQGDLLGLGKISEERLKNLLPRRLVL